MSHREFVSPQPGRTRFRILLLAAWMLAFAAAARAAQPDVVHAVIIKVNGDPVYKNDIVDRVEQYVEERGLEGEELDAEIKAGLSREAIRELVKDRLVEQEAKLKGVAVQVKDVRDYMERYHIPDTPFNLEQTRKDMLFDRLMQKEGMAILPPSPRKVRKVYHDNRALFTMPKVVKARHIMVQKMNEYTYESEKRKAKRIHEEVAEDGSNFEELARAYCYSRRDRELGGLLIVPGATRRDGYIATEAPALERSLPEELVEKLRTLRDGEVSDIFESERGFHIVYLEDEVPGRVVSFREAFPHIERFVRNLERTQRERVWLIEAIRRSNITWHNKKPVKYEEIRPEIPTFDIHDLVGR